MKRKLFAVLLLILLVFVISKTENAEAQTLNDRRENKTDFNLTIENESLNLFDKARNRLVPVVLYSTVSGSVPKIKSKKLKLALINHGYGMKNTDYTFVAETLVAEGYLVASIQHEIAGDEPIPTVGKPSEVRRPNWERGVQNILFVIEELKKTKPELDVKNLLLIGHSNGGDTAMLFAQNYPQKAQKVITLDNRRMPIPRVKKPQILSIRSSDQTADEGVLPTDGEQKKFGIRIVKLQNTKHDEMWDGASVEQKLEINEIISEFLKGNRKSRTKRKSDLEKEIRKIARRKIIAEVARTVWNYWSEKKFDRRM